MAKSEFSETQFVFGFLNEMYFSQHRHFRNFPYWKHFMFPTTFEERRFPVDFMLEYTSHSVFFQFKRSSHLQNRNSRNNCNIPKSYSDYYRFKIYNRNTNGNNGQFEKLIELTNEISINDLVCYCAPCFHTEAEFHQHFQMKTIRKNSVFIDCRQFNNKMYKPPFFNINDGLSHYMIYKNNTPKGYICSEPIEIELKNAEDWIENHKAENENSIETTIKSLYHNIYLKDDIVNSDLRKTAENIGEQFHIVRNYLFQYYNILWQPILKRFK